MTQVTSHFKTMMVVDQSQEPPVEITVSEYVSTGQLLVSIPNVDAPRSKRVVLEAGENAQLTEDETGIVATCHGYPKSILKTAEKGQTAQVSVIPLIRKAENLMEVQLDLYPPVAGQKLPGLQAILDILSQAEVTFGIDTAAIEAALHTVAETGLPLLNAIIARGRTPLDGKDAMLRFEVEIGPTPGKLLGNGSIDFRERTMFVAVAANQIVAHKVPATSGKAGVNIAGEPIPAQDGKDLQVKVSEDTSFCEEDGIIRATAGGVLTLVNNDTIRVSSQQRINGNIDYSTGNIRSQSAVEITGSILPEFMVSTKGDLLVGGDIQAASVNSHGNIVVKGGILGPLSNVRVQGDADINYIERSLLNAGGDIVIRSSGYYSTIIAAGDIQCPDKVKLVGGDIIAGGSIVVGQIGSASGEPARITVGVAPRRYRRYREMQKNHKELLAEIQNWYNRHGREKKSRKVEVMEEELAVLERELSRFNLIPGMAEDSLGDPGALHTDSQIRVSGRITAGTRVRIGNETLVLKRDLIKSTICMDPKGGTIIVVTL